MTPAAPRTAAPEARMGARRALGAYRLAWAAMDSGFELAKRQGNELAWLELWGKEFDLWSIRIDLEVSRRYDTPAHREHQLAIWAERERRALIGEIAW